MKWHAQSKILIQGIAEPLGSHYGLRMKAYGTAIVGGVSGGHGQESLGDIPVFDLVEDAIAAFGAIDISLLLVPPYEVLDAALEAMASGIRQLVIGTAGVPPLDMIQLLKAAQATQTLILGSGSSGILIPGQFWLGLWEPQFYLPGSVGILSRSDRLTDDLAGQLSAAGIGQSLVIGLGTDGILGTDLEQGLQILEEDENTAVILLIGQVNSNDAIDAADYIAANIEKPVIAYFPGHQIPLAKSLRNATAIIADQLSPQRSHRPLQPPVLSAFQSADIPLADRPSTMVALIQSALQSAALPTPEFPTPELPAPELPTPELPTPKLPTPERQTLNVPRLEPLTVELAPSPIPTAPVPPPVTAHPKAASPRKLIPPRPPKMPPSQE